MTTILIKKKDTAGAPAAGDLTNAAGGAEIAVNTATKRIYTKDSGGNVVETGTNPSILNVDNIQIDVNTISSTDTNGNINLTPNGTGSVVISKLNVTGAITFDGNVTVGNSSSDTLTVNSTITSNLIFTDNTYDIGASGATRPRSLFLGSNITAGGTISATGIIRAGGSTDGTFQASTTAGYTITGGPNYSGFYYDVPAGTAHRVRVNSTDIATTSSTGLAVTGTLTSSGNVGAGTTTTNYPLSLPGNVSTYQASGTQMGFGSSGFSGYGPHIGTANRTYVHFIGAGGGSAMSSWFHGYQVGNPAASNWMRVAPGISGNPVSGLVVQSTGVYWYYNANKTTGDADYTPTLYHTLDNSGAAFTGSVTSTVDSYFYGVRAGRGAGANATNTVLGTNALSGANTGDVSVAIGYNALASNTSGNWNIAIGKDAMLANLTGSNNTVVGRALATNQSGSDNTAIGQVALYYTTSSNNTAVGSNSLFVNDTGAGNTAVGASALKYNTASSSQTAIGNQALQNITGSFNGGNTALGQGAGYTQTSGYSNTYVGYNSGYSMTSGIKNTILGSFNGNQSGLDMRTSSNYVVLSDGDGNPRGVCDNNGAWNLNRMSGINVTQTSTSGTTSIIDTGIYFNTSVSGYNRYSVYEMYLTGCPNAGGSAAYKSVVVGLIIVVTGYTYAIPGIIQEIRYVEQANQTGSNNAAFTVTLKFWNGSTESDYVADSTTNAQIRIKVTGYNSSYVGDGQLVYLTKRI